VPDVGWGVPQTTRKQRVCHAAGDRLSEQSQEPPAGSAVGSVPRTRRRTSETGTGARRPAPATTGAALSCGHASSKDVEQQPWTVTGGGRAPLAVMTARIIGIGLALRTKGPVAFPHATPRGSLRLPCVAEFGPEVNPRTLAEMREHLARLERLLDPRAPHHRGRHRRERGGRRRGRPPMSPDLQDALTGAGLDTADFASRRSAAEQVEHASLVLVAERAHRPAVVAQVPSGLGRTFTIREFGRSIAASDTTAISGTPAGRAGRCSCGAAWCAATAQPPRRRRPLPPGRGSGSDLLGAVAVLPRRMDRSGCRPAFRLARSVGHTQPHPPWVTSRNGHFLHAHFSVGREGILRACTQTVSWQITASWVGCRVSVRPVYLLRRSSV